MPTYTPIPDADIDPDSPVTVTLQTLMRDNPIAITEGAAGAPNIVAAALATDSVETDKIKGLAVTSPKMAVDSVLTGAIKDLNVTTVKINTLAVTAAKLATDAVETSKIKDLNVTAAKLATDAVTTIKIDDRAATTAKIGLNAVETNNIKNVNVTEQKLATDAVTANKIKAATVTKVKLAPDVHKVLFTDVIEVGNVGAGEQDLMSYTMPANTMPDNGTRLRITAFFKGNNADNVTILFYFGADFVAAIVTTPIGTSEFALKVVCDVVRRAPTAQRGFVQSWSVAGLELTLPMQPGETMSGAIVIKFTGENTTDATSNAVVQAYMQVEYIPD